MTTPAHTARREQGFAIVAVLLVVTLMTTLGATYLRHVLVEQPQSLTARSTIDAQEAVHSGCNFAQQALNVGKDALTATVTNGNKTASIQVDELADGHGRMFVRSVNDYGIGATVLAEVARTPEPVTSHPDDLPGIDPDTLDEIMGDPTIEKHYYGGQQWIRDCDLEGVVVVRNTSAVFFDNVTIRGVLVSEDALSTDPIGDFDPSTTPCALTDGSLRITPGDFLPGVAVVMPDGVLTNYHNDSSVQIEGDIIAYRCSLEAIGSIRGNIATVVPAEIDESIVRPGSGRGPTEWSDDLSMGSTWNTAYLAFLPRVSTVGQLSAITGYSFPSAPAHAVSEEENFTSP